MEVRQLGRSGLRVSTLAFGTMTFGGEGVYAISGTTDVEGARRQLDLCIEAGVTTVDTADAYSDGRSEEILGKVLQGRRHHLLVSTKVRFQTGPGPNDAGLSRHHIIESCEASLRRLGIDHIDLYHMHEWDGQTPVEETLGALDDLVRSGKVRYVACSNFAAWQMMKALGIAVARGLPQFASTQVYYSLLERSVEREVVPACIDQGVGILVWSPLAGGLLSGSYRRGVDAPPGSRHLNPDWPEPPVHDWEVLYDTIEVLFEIAHGHGVTPAQVALAWLLSRPGITSLVIGARSEEQLAGNLKAADLVLGDEEVRRLEEVSRPPLPYPHWHQASSAFDRLGEADLALVRPYLEARGAPHLGSSPAEPLTSPPD
jgi:aryl-alcohol dehydrogenase-like predicted oxidoreductase